MIRKINHGLEQFMGSYWYWVNLMSYSDKEYIDMTNDWFFSSLSLNVDHYKQGQSWYLFNLMGCHPED